MGLWQHADSGKLLINSGNSLITCAECPCCAATSETLIVTIAGVSLNPDADPDVYTEFEGNGTFTLTWNGSTWESSSFTLFVYDDGVDPPVDQPATVTASCLNGLYSAAINPDIGLGYINSYLSFGDTGEGGVPKHLNTAITADTQPPDGDYMEGGTATVTKV